MIEYCKGNCNQEAKFRGWCSEKYNDCPGYRKKLSDKAKARGWTGAKGLLNKKYFIDNPQEKIEATCICSDCKNQFIRKARRIVLIKSNFSGVCSTCRTRRMITSLKKTLFERDKNSAYEKLNNSKRKRICWSEQGSKCNECGYDKYDIEVGPYELHHKDGNILNKNRENEEVLCSNCHHMTENFRFKNRNHSKESKEKISLHNWNSREKVWMDTAHGQ